VYQFVQKDKGGTIYYDVNHGAPARWDADPTPTVTIVSREGGEIVASQSATEGPSTTLTAVASAKKKTAVVTATTGISVDDVLILGTNGSGQWEWVTVDAINTSTKTITFRDELAYTYASGDAIKSTRLSVALSASNAGAIYNDARAQWAYEISDQAIVEESIFHISAWAPKMTLRDQDILKLNPRAIKMLGTRQRLTQLIKEVWERIILADFGAQYKPGSLVSGAALHQAHLYRVLAETAIVAEDVTQTEQYLESFKNAWSRSIIQTLIDTDNSGTIGDDDIVRPSMTGRIYRGS
jgi:hypothetical protein